MQTLLTVIMTWLSINFGLPETGELPAVELASRAEMAAVRQERVATGTSQALAPDVGEKVFAIYDDESATIYLHHDWSGATPAESSLLVHELVHHLQNVGGMEFACAGAREKVAYRAQRAWLELFDRTLEQEFGLDPMTVLVRSNCLM